MDTRNTSKGITAYPSLIQQGLLAQSLPDLLNSAGSSKAKAPWNFSFRTCLFRSSTTQIHGAQLVQVLCQSWEIWPTLQSQAVPAACCSAWGFWYSLVSALQMFCHTKVFWKERQQRSGMEVWVDCCKGCKSSFGMTEGGVQQLGLLEEQ